MGTEVLRKKLRFATSEEFMDYVHELQIVSVIPNCHKIRENFPSFLLVDLDPWWSVTFEELRERLLDYCAFLRNHGITFYITGSGNRSFHVYIPVTEWRDCSVLLPRPISPNTFFSRHKEELSFFGARDAMELLNIYYATISPLGPITPHVCIFDMEVRIDNTLFDLRIGKNQGTRCLGSLHHKTLGVCRVFELRDIPTRWGGLRN